MTFQCGDKVKIVNVPGHKLWNGSVVEVVDRYPHELDPFGFWYYVLGHFGLVWVYGEWYEEQDNPQKEKRSEK